jgi:hypothetical protein
MDNIQIRPATIADLDTLYRFEQDLIAIERPFNPTFKPDPIHYYDLAAMIAAPDVHVIEALRAWSQARGITELRLDVYSDNTRAIRAYEKAGFIPHLLHMRRTV